MTNQLRRALLLGSLTLPFHSALARGRDTLAGFPNFPGQVFPDIAYSDISDRSNSMDIYLPSTGRMHPMVLWVHGGGFGGGDKRSQMALTKALPGLASAGIAVAAVNYRLSGEAIWPAQRDDLTAAFRYLRENADQYGCDGGKMAIFGTSAGATLALVAGFDEAVSGRGVLKAIAAWYPATLFPEMDNDMAQDFPVLKSEAMSGPSSMISRLLGQSMAEDPEAALEASPIAILSRLPIDLALPPVLLAAGTNDKTISWRQSQRMADALQQLSNPPPVNYTVYPGAGHGSGAFRGLAISRLVDFLAQNLTN